MPFAVSGTQQLWNKENTVKKNWQSWAVLKRSERIAGFQTKALCLMCVSYFMTLDNCFHLSVASVLTSIAVCFALGRCWYLTDGLFKMWYGFISSEAWAAKHSLLRSYKVRSHQCLAGSKSVTVLTWWREYRTFNICCLWLFRWLQPIDF